MKGDSVSLGYWLDRDKSWTTFHGHWCRTGDLFRVDEEGYLYFAGRADDLLKVGGQWVAPLEVEECLLGHPAVAAAAVIGVEEEGLVKTKAFVVLRAGPARGERRRARRRAPGARAGRSLRKHKYPRWVEFVDDLPKNDRGKVDKKALERERAGESRGPERMARRLAELTYEEVAAAPRGARPVGRHRPGRQRRAARPASAARHRHRHQRDVRRRAAADRSSEPGALVARRRAARPLRRHRLRAAASPARSAFPPRRSPRCSRAIATASRHRLRARLLRQQPPRARARRRRARRDRGLPAGRGLGRVPAHAPLGPHALRRVQARRLPRRSLRDVARARRRDETRWTPPRRSALPDLDDQPLRRDSRPARTPSAAMGLDRAYTGAPAARDAPKRARSSRPLADDDGHRGPRRARDL